MNVSQPRSSLWRRLRAALAAAVFVTVGVALGPNNGSGAPVVGGDATMSIFGTPGGVLLTDFLPTDMAILIGESTNRSLLSYTPNLQLLPDLAERWTVSADGRTTTFVLRPGLKWSDGAPLTPQDFEYATLALSAPGSNAFWYNRVDEIVGVREHKAGTSDGVAGFKIMNDRTFAVTTVAPSSDFIDLFGTEMFPMPSHVLKTIPFSQLMKSDFAHLPNVSSGPFYISNYQTDTQAELTRNPYYYARQPSLAHVYIKVLQPEVAIVQLERGELQVIPGDIGGNLTPGDLPALQRVPNIAVTSYPNTTVVSMYINVKRKPFDDVRVRQALAYAIDRDAIVSQLLLGKGEIAYSPFASFTPYYDKNLEPYKFNPDHARQLLRDAHYDPSVRLRLLVPTGETLRMNVGTVIQQQLQNVGMNVSIELADYATSVSRLDGTHDFDLGLEDNRGFNNPDLSRRFHTGGALNAGQYSNPELDQLIDQARQLVVLRQQLPVLTKIQQIINQDVPTVMLYYADSIGAVNVGQLGGAVPRFGGMFRDMANWYRR